MAKQNKAEQAQGAKPAPKAPVYVSGFGVHEGNVFVTFKDVKTVNPLFKARGAQHNGSRFLNKGVTIEEAKTEFPLGTEVEFAYWGAERESKFENGNLFEVVFEGEEED